MPPSSSDPRARSTAFDRLHPRIQRWIYNQRWTTLREVQEAAVDPILAASDVVIAAATAGGKTEAAFLPICSMIVAQPPVGIQVLYVSPLKALINDQYDRLERLGTHLDLAVHRWHGDVGTSTKQEVLRDPRGILIITPESLEGAVPPAGQDGTNGGRWSRVFSGARASDHHRSRRRRFRLSCLGQLLESTDGTQ